MRVLTKAVLICLALILLHGEVTPYQIYLPIIAKPPPIRVFDADGIERDLAWAIEEYNVKVIVTDCEGDKRWALVELREVIGPSSMTVSLTEPIEGIPIAIYWPDAPDPSLPGEPKPVKLVQFTNAEGQTGFGMGAYYKPWLGECGPYAVWVSNYPQDVSDLVDCLGMVGGTNHAHLEPTFRAIPCGQDWGENHEAHPLLWRYALRFIAGAMAPGHQEEKGWWDNAKQISIGHVENLEPSFNGTLTRKVARWLPGGGEHGREH